jgi:Alpha/beta hydrolase family
LGVLFADDFHDEFGTWPLAYIPYGGADFGELAAVARAVGDGDDDAFYRAWVEAADHLQSEADERLSAGHRESARELYLRASSYYATSYHPLYGEPVDARLLDAFRKQVAALDQGLALGRVPVKASRIPLGDTSMPAYLLPAIGHETDVRPLVIFTNGYDATITDMYFACAVAATQRGYHALLFDGPGQGEMLYEQGVRLRPDWEVVTSAVVDFAVEQSIVDRDRIALSGWSLGGYLAPRGASGEHRLAAVIADPGQWSVADSARGFAIKLGATAEQAAHLGRLDQKLIDQIMAVVKKNKRLYWSIVSRGFWVNGSRNLQEFLAQTEEYTLEGRGGDIACPTLLTVPENDPLADSYQSFVKALGDRATVIHFTAAEGAGQHCEMFNRTRLNRRVFDWLDDTLGRP